MTDSTIVFVASAVSGSIAAIPGIIAALRMYKVEQKVEVVRGIVDGPLSVALKSNADLATRIAKLTQDPADVQAAAKAQIIDENRKEGKYPTQPA